jgi:hypothetical protein
METVETQFVPDPHRDQQDARQANRKSKDNNERIYFVLHNIPDSGLQIILKHSNLFFLSIRLSKNMKFLLSISLARLVP